MRAVILTAAVSCALLLVPSAGAKTADEKPWLGISFNTGHNHVGVLIVEIIPDTPADEAGFVVGDYIISIDGTELHSGGELVEAVATKKVGDDIVVHVQRGDKDVVITVTLERFPTADEILFKRMVGTTAPALDIEIVSGTASVDKLSGRVLVVEMFATWCEACEPTHAELSKLAANHNEDDLVVLAVAHEYARTLTAWQGDTAWHHNIARDLYGSTWTGYQMTSQGASLPTIYVIDAKGTIIFAGMGADRVKDAIFEAERAVSKKYRK